MRSHCRNALFCVLASFAGLNAPRSSLAAGVQRLSLADYQLTLQVALLPVVNEASAVAFNPNSNTLFILGDGGNAIAQFSTAGAFINSMTLSGFSDAEGLTYLGGSTFVIADERIQTAYLISYASPGNRSRSTLPAAVLDPSYSDNLGLEGICVDPTTGNYLAIKQNLPQRVYSATINFAAGTASTQELFSPASLNLQTLSDIASPSVVPSIAAGVGRSDLLIVSAASKRLVCATRTGSVLSTFNLAGLSNTMEGIAIAPDATIYLVAETNLTLANTSAPALFVLRPRCIADFNRAGGASVQDIFDFLAAWAAVAPAADINHDGSVSVQDIFDFLEAWFQGC